MRKTTVVMKYELKEYNLNINDEELIADVISVAKKIGKNTVTMQDYSQNGRFHPSTLMRRFNSWIIVLDKAGLDKKRNPVNISEEDFFKNLASVWIQLGRQPVMAEMKAPLSKYRASTYHRHFGTWMNALRKFIEYENSEFSEDEEILKDEVILSDSPPKKSQITLKDSRNISQRLRFSVLLRDGFRCTACGKSPISNPGTELHCDHILPWSKGGLTIMDNLKTLCSQCNLGKGNMLETNL